MLEFSVWYEWVSQLEKWASHVPDTMRSLPHHPLCPIGKRTGATLHHLNELHFLTLLGVQGTLVNVPGLEAVLMPAGGWGVAPVQSEPLHRS